MRKGTRQDYIDDRAADLMANYRQVVSEGDCTSMKQAFRRVIARPAKRFYVSSDRAYHVLLRMRKVGVKALNGMTKEHRMMFIDLWAVIQRMKNMPLFREASLYFIVDLAIAQPAPRFYITVETLKKIFYQWKRERRYHK